jgi:hypothetical protein
MDLRYAEYNEGRINPNSSIAQTIREKIHSL